MKKKINKRTSFKRDKNTKIKTLEQKLNEIYSEHNLETTCCRNLTCCKTACPQMNFCEFSNIINSVWKCDRKTKVELISKSVEYFFKNEFEKFQMETLLKPCMLLDDKEKKCKIYNQRPLSCRLYGLWPNDLYTKRVDKFEKAYEGVLKREEIPLNTQCPHVVRKDNQIPLTEEIINHLYQELDKIDEKYYDYTKSQIDDRHNYRTFQDWLLLKTFGESWLINLTNFMMSAKKEDILDLIEKIKTAITTKKVL